jgi:hypothetical protein
MKTKIANAEQMKVHPAEAGLVIGNRDMEANAVGLRVHGQGISARSRAMKSSLTFAVDR